MTEGTVKWYNDTKGFGFISVPGRNDVFVHRSGLSNPYEVLTEGQSVSFDLKNGQKGEMATNVR